MSASLRECAHKQAALHSSEAVATAETNKPLAGMPSAMTSYIQLTMLVTVAEVAGSGLSCTVGQRDNRRSSRKSEMCLSAQQARSGFLTITVYVSCTLTAHTLNSNTPGETC
jgi:hypothetical protein